VFARFLLPISPPCDMINKKAVKRMHTAKQLINKLNELHLDYYEMASDINEDVAIQLVDFEQLFLFLKKHNIDTVFYRFEFPSADVLQITEDVLSELHIDDDIIEVMKKDFEEYNRSVSNLDFSRPYLLSVCCLYQGHIVYIMESDYWFEDWGFGHPKRIAISMIEEKLEAIENKKEEAHLKREELRRQLREKLLADPNFHKCTNKELRRSYTQKLCNADKSIQDLFYSPKHGIYDIMIGAFIEEVWKEYKASL
jgi:hypothetical protein